MALDQGYEQYAEQNPALPADTHGMYSHVVHNSASNKTFPKNGHTPSLTNGHKRQNGQRDETSTEPIFVGVPARLNHFIGRDNLLADLIEQLTSPQPTNLALHGLAGIGKTALAVAVAYETRILEHFTAGVLWARLGQTPDIEGILSRWAKALRLDSTKLPEVTSLAGAIKQIASERKLLVVFDDVWDLSDVQTLRIASSDSSYLLTTCQQSIARTFAHTDSVIFVPPLSDDDAFQLFCQLAPEACTDDEEAARALSDAAGGLPLALELVGNYLASPEHSYFPDLSIKALTDMKDVRKRLQLAKKPLGAFSLKAYTLKEAITRRLERLPQEAKRAFYALGAFGPDSTFDLKAAETITGVDLDTIALLVDRSLVNVVKDNELHLHEVVAEVAQTGVTADALQRFKTYYA